jgi:hypothetical protein
LSVDYEKRLSITVGWPSVAIFIDESFTAGISDMKERFVPVIIPVFDRIILTIGSCREWIMNSNAFQDSQTF